MRVNFFIKKYFNKFEWFGMLDQDSLLDVKYINFINEKFNFDNNNRLLNDKGVPYNLVHQYDKRWDEFSYNFQKFIENL